MTSKTIDHGNIKMKIYSFEVNTVNIFIWCNKKHPNFHSKFSLVLCTHENADLFITLDENISGIHFKSVNILSIYFFVARC